MITYAADSHELYGELYYRPAKRHAPGALREIHDWDSGKLLGTIPEVAQTYRVVGNMNEHQVVIAESTFGGREELVDPAGGIDYGSMIYVALERARTARQAIDIMVGLAQAHGYASKGESFSIADPKEVWIMDLIGKGPDEKGVVWVARKLPDGTVSAHANQARIRQFPLNDPEQCKYAPDVITFARKKGYFNGPDEEFSFTDAYAPPSCRDLRVREARVWSFFRGVAPSLQLSSDYVRCKPGSSALPLWIKPDRKLSAKDLMRWMRDHFEGTEFDMRNDVGAGPYALPYRWRPMTWKLDGKTYLHERAIATQQTGFSFVSQSRDFLPAPVGGLLWFSVDDAASTVYVPMYSGISQVSKPYAVGTGSFTKFTWDSAFWVFNWVANQAYARYSDMIQDIGKEQRKLEDGFFAEQAALEAKAAKAYAQSPAAAEKVLTAYSVAAGERVVARWRTLGEELLVKYLDGNVRNEKGEIEHPAYPEHWYRRIVAETGDHLRADGPAASASAPAAIASAAPASSASEPQRSGCSTAPNGAGQGVWVGIMAGLAAMLGHRRRAGTHGLH